MRHNDLSKHNDLSNGMVVDSILKTHRSWQKISKSLWIKASA